MCKVRLRHNVMARCLQEATRDACEMKSSVADHRIGAGNVTLQGGTVRGHLRRNAKQSGGHHAMQCASKSGEGRGQDRKTASYNCRAVVPYSTASLQAALASFNSCQGSRLYACEGIGGVHVC